VAGSLCGLIERFYSQAQLAVGPGRAGCAFISCGNDQPVGQALEKPPYASLGVFLGLDLGGEPVSYEMILY